MSNSTPRATGHRGDTHNTSSRVKSRSKSTVSIIDCLLFSPVKTTLDGKESTMTVLEAIVLQLLQKTMSGDLRAHKVLLKYQELACRNANKSLDIKFLDNAYTATLANWRVTNGQD